MSRGFSITYGAVMCIAFAGVGLYGYNEPPAQLVWIFGSGIHAGIAFMWLISPRITEKWRKEMETELDKIANECLTRMHQHILAESQAPPISPHQPYGRTLQ
jgi:hypothetical protein